MDARLPSELNISDVRSQQHTAVPCASKLCRRAVRYGLTIVELLVVLAVIGLLMALLLPAVQRSVAAARKMSCTSNLRQLGLAFHSYHETHRILPPGTICQPGFCIAPGNDACRGCDGLGRWADDNSWYPLLLPYVEQSALWEQIDFDMALAAPASMRIPQPGEAAFGNYLARTTQLPLFGCPEDGLQKNEFDTAWARIRMNYAVNFGSTNYGQQRNFQNVRFQGAPFGIGRGVRFRDIQDGASSTLMMMEVIATHGDDWNGYTSDITLAGGAGVQAHYGPNPDACEQLARTCFDRQAANGIPCCEVIGFGADDIIHQVMSARSHHTGGVNVLLADGSVRLAADTIDLSVWHHLAGTRDGPAEAR